MTVLFVGDADDARGFALAGALARAAATPAEIEAALADRQDVGLILLSASAARAAPHALEAVDTPVLVLPEVDRADAR
jgi:vacuolar-type H+-ATPase subunit F/Vma7